MNIIRLNLSAKVMDEKMLIGRRLIGNDLISLRGWLFDNYLMNYQIINCYWPIGNN
jgi:hypothetical protein